MTSIHTLLEEVERLENRAIWENAPPLGIQAALLSESLARDFADGSSRNLARGIELRLRFGPSASGDGGGVCRRRGPRGGTRAQVRARLRAAFLDLR